MGRRPAVRLIAMAIVLLLMAAFCKWCSTRCKLSTPVENWTVCAG
jgi:hypothetical protein